MQQNYSASTAAANAVVRAERAGATTAAGENTRVGRHDRITPVSCSQAIADLIPNSELVVFEKSGHFPQIEEVELWTNTVREFSARTRLPHDEKPAER